MRTPRCSCTFPSDIDTPPASNVGGCSVGMKSNSSKADEDSEGRRYSSDEERWGLVSDEDEDAKLFPPHQHSDSLRGEGVLIISGDEESTVDSYRRGILHHHKKNPPILSVEHLARSGAELSLPDTDASLPTDLDSLDAGSILLRDEQSRSEAGDPKRQNEIKNENETPGHGDREGKIRNLYMPIVSAVLLACMVLTSGFLVWDRNSWRSSAIRLEEELNLLQARVNETQAEIERLLLETKLKREDPPQEKKSDNCGSKDDGFFFPPKDQQKVVFADNCWLQAEASFTLGSCADQAKERAKGATDHVWEWFTEIQKTFQDDFVLDQDVHNDKQRNETKKATKDVADNVWEWIAQIQKSFQDDVSDTNVHNDMQRHNTRKSPSEHCLEDKGICFSPKWKSLQQAGLNLDDISDMSHSVAAATVAAGDAVMDIVQGAGSLVEDYVKQVIDITMNSMGDDSIFEFID
mmetsp:Transcript_9110/g.14026  ORF Transcript_9110/g.14026 Transcript_9110/m.14026 type:complete len:464 (+) Transcript_9110:91-1482(+)